MRILCTGGSGFRLPSSNGNLLVCKSFLRHPYTPLLQEMYPEFRAAFRPVSVGSDLMRRHLCLFTKAADTKCGFIGWRGTILVWLYMLPRSDNASSKNVPAGPKAPAFSFATTTLKLGMTLDDPH